ncbi:hypothetical protein D4R30_00370 [archaeon]|nr:MAG: hypothetical protein D4R30_00370 [archaeon]
MPIKPRLIGAIKEDTATGSAWTAASLKTYGSLIPPDPVACIYAAIESSAVTDAATYAQAVGELLAGLEVNLAGFGLIHRAFSGVEWIELLRRLTGIRSLPYRGAQADNAWGTLAVPIPFGIPFGNEKMGIPAKAQGAYQAHTVMGTSSHLDGLRLGYVADVIYGPAPKEVLTTDYFSVTGQAASADQVKFQKPGKLRGILWFDTTAYDTDDMELLIGGASIDFKTLSHAEAAKFAAKNFGGIAAGGTDTTLATSYANYVFLDLGEDPAGWPDVTGKEVIIRATCATAEAKRAIPVLVRPIV